MSDSSNAESPAAVGDYESERVPAGWFRVAAIYADIGIQEPIEGRNWRAYPFRMPDASAVSAVRAYRELVGVSPAEPDPEPPDRFAVAIETAVQTPSADKAFAIAGPRLDGVATALGFFLQMGRGPRLALIAFGHDGVMDIEHSVLAPNIIGWPSGAALAEKIDELQDAMTRDPGVHLVADLFAQACRDGDPSSSVSRFWFLLEASAERFGGHDIDQVRALAKHLGFENNLFDDPPHDLIRAGYDARIAFTHTGRRSADDQLQLAMARLAFVLLSEAQLGRVDPQSPRHPAKGVRFNERKVARPKRLGQSPERESVEKGNGSK